MIRVISLLLFPVLLFGQSADDILDRFDYEDYQTGQHGVVSDSLGNICPWQSWRFVIYQSFQVDFILNDVQLAAFEPRLADEDLVYFAMGGNRDALNIAERDYTAQIHSPGLVCPIIRNYDFVWPDTACDFENNNPQWGWSRRILGNNMAMASRVVSPGVYHISFARFVLHQGFFDILRATGYTAEMIEAVKTKVLTLRYDN